MAAPRAAAAKAAYNTVFILRHPALRLRRYHIIQKIAALPCPSSLTLPCPAQPATGQVDLELEICFEARLGRTIIFIEMFCCNFY